MNSDFIDDIAEGILFVKNFLFDQFFNGNLFEKLILGSSYMHPISQ